MLISIHLFSQSNDCANAVSLNAGGGSCVQTAYNVTNTFTHTGTDPNCGGTGEVDGWFTFTATHVLTEIEASISAGSDLYLTVYSGSCGSLTEVACSDANGSGQGEVAKIYTTVGDQYWIMLTTNATSTFSGNVCVFESSDNTDCITATRICSDEQFGGNSSGFGIQELNSTNNGCITDFEKQSSWYKFQVSSGGTLQMTITPQGSNEDYDFAIWATDQSFTCPTSSTPVRCSYSTVNGPTGMNASSTDNSEDQNGDSFVSEMNVNTGDSYYLLINNFLSTTNPFNVTWGGTASLTCSFLPVEVQDFNGRAHNQTNVLTWNSQSERNNDFYTIDKSEDGIVWSELTKVDGAGNSTSTIDYEFIDIKPFSGKNYYRLSQTDFDGTKEYLGVVYVNNSNINYRLEGQNLYLSKYSDYELVSSSGQTILSGKGNSIDVSSIKQGVYFLKLNDSIEKLFIDTNF